MEFMRTLVGKMESATSFSISRGHWHLIAIILPGVRHGAMRRGRRGERLHSVVGVNLTSLLVEVLCFDSCPPVVGTIWVVSVDVLNP